MSTLQNTTRHPERVKTRRRTGALALSALRASGAALLILPTAHHTARPPTAGIARPAAPAALTTPASGVGNCLVNPDNPALACYHAAHSAPPAAPTIQASGLGNCLVNPGNQARACYHAARASIETPARSGYFRDPATHKLRRVPIVRNRTHRHPPNRSTGGVAP
jgi:hypothetical protein